MVRLLSLVASAWYFAYSDGYEDNDDYYLRWDKDKTVEATTQLNYEECSHFVNRHTESA